MAHTVAHDGPARAGGRSLREVGPDVRRRGGGVLHRHRPAPGRAGRGAAGRARGRPRVRPRRGPVPGRHRGRAHRHGARHRPGADDGGADPRRRPGPRPGARVGRDGRRAGAGAHHRAVRRGAVVADGVLPAGPGGRPPGLAGSRRRRRPAGHHHLRRRRRPALGVAGGDLPVPRPGTVDTRQRGGPGRLDRRRHQPLQLHRTAARAAGRGRLAGRDVRRAGPRRALRRRRPVGGVVLVARDAAGLGADGRERPAGR